MNSRRYNSSYNNPQAQAQAFLAGQNCSIEKNVMYDEKGYIGTNSTNLGDLVIASGTFYGMKVSDFLALAEKAIGGCGVEVIHSLNLMKPLQQ